MKLKKGMGSWIGFLAALTLVLAGCGGSSDVNLNEGDEGDYGPSILASTPSELGVGDALIVDFSSSQASLDFSGVETGAKFILAVGSSSALGNGATIQLSPDLSLPDPLAGEKAMEVEGEIMEDEGYGADEIFSAWLRAAEMDLDVNEVPSSVAFSESSMKGMSVKAQSLGDREVFRVLSSLSSPSSYVEVTGVVRHVGSNVLCYVDSRVSEDILSDADVDGLCGDFDGEVGEMAALLGDSSDVDDDGKVHVLMTPQ
ncbi:MAG: hypothetical protein WC683_19025, partial [bacterium]